MGGFAVVHMMKHKSGAVGGIQSHNNREHEPRSNPDVDSSKTRYNYHLVECDNYRSSIKKKIQSLVTSQKAVRSDAVMMCSFIITSDHDTMAALPFTAQKDYFRDALRWFERRYGADRIIAASVHMDEKTPHLHLSLVPITADGRLSAKAIFTKKELTAIQTEFAAEVGSRYGLKRGVVGSDRQHLSEIQYKTQTAQEQLNQLQERQEALQADLRELEGHILTSQQVKEQKLYKPLLGRSDGFVKLPYSEYMDLRATAAQIDKYKQQSRTAQEQAQSVLSQEKAMMAAAQENIRQLYLQRQEQWDSMEQDAHDRADLIVDLAKAKAAEIEMDAKKELQSTQQELQSTQQQLQSAQKQLSLYEKVMQRNPDLKERFDAAIKLLSAPVKKKKLSL